MSNVQPLTRATTIESGKGSPSDAPFSLSLNESPFPPLPTVVDAMVAAAGSANRYPEFFPESMRQLIATRMGVDAAQVVVGAGATGVLMQVLQAFTDPGDRIVMAYPTFDGYPIFAQIARLISVTVPLDARGHHDIDRIADVAADARVVVLCRPHNPTGTIESEGDIRSLLARIPGDTIVVLDEAYVEFVAPSAQIDIAMLVADFPNVIVVRTFSKAYGLADIRTGYAFCAANLARTLWGMQLPFCCPSMSLAAVSASFRAEAQLRQRVKAIVDERCHLRTHLSAMGFWTPDSHANFVYLPPGGIPTSEQFEADGLRIRFYGDGGARITVGTHHSTQAVLSALGRRR